MLLKSLELQGFKTFPDKTTLSFKHGITAVVGPNGSGKSNISDAIRWVLGEQSSKTIRCSKMEDVIFSGTPIRKSQGFAEVTLVIDNSNRNLAFDNDEVAITRRYYRSGESEYLINKASVRLKDIHELFMDTGLGRDGYSMISQGKIDSIVASKSEDRREIFEEAAGISKYRYRRAEAQRRLVQSEENLLRLRDILKELEDRVGPLEEQSKKAKSYLEYMDKKRGLEIGLWLETLNQSACTIREQEEKVSISKNQYNQADTQLESLRNESEQIFFKLNSHTARVDEIRKNISTLEESTSEKVREVSVFENDMLHNNENITRIKNEIEAVKSSSTNMEKEIKDRELKISDGQACLSKKEAELVECNNDIDDLTKKIAGFSDKNKELSTELSTLGIKLSNAKVERMTSLTSANEIKGRLNVVNSSILQKQGQIEELKATVSDYNKMLDDIKENVESLSNTVKGYEIQLENKCKKRDDLKKNHDKLTLDYEEKIRKTRLLEELERNLEGFTQSVKTVMKEYSRGTLSGIHGPVSRIIKVPPKYAVAVETSLGAAMQNIVVGNEEDAKRAIGLLKQRDAGRATFLPLTTIKGNELKDDDLKSCDGFLGIASALCNCEQKYSGILHSLLGRIVIVDNLNNAVLLAKKFSYKFRVVTLDGQVVNAGGSLTGGSLARNSGLLIRSSEIEKTKKEAESLKSEAQTVRLQLKDAVGVVSNIEAQLCSARAELSTAQEDKIRVESEFKNSNLEYQRVNADLNELMSEKQSSEQRISELDVAYKKSEESILSLSKDIEELEQKISSSLGDKDVMISEREKLLSNLQNIKIDIYSTKKDIDVLRSEILDMQNRRNYQDERLAALLDEIDLLNDGNITLLGKIEKLKDEIELQKLSAKDLENSISELNNQRMELEKRTVEIRNLERDKSTEVENLSRELARLEERKTNLQTEYDSIISRLWEDYELTRREAEQVAEKIEDVIAAKKKLNELKLKIKNLGTVNVSAIDEYKEVFERYNFMSSQINDVEKSKQELTRLIAELTQQMRELFLTSFDQINKNFSTTFKELFGGGNARLYMTDESDILNSGIEIEVQPPGKIVNHLEALSGGERALIAIALYFAIMKVRPAPFCVLDEIEAALDDINVDKFASYLRRMNSNTQFIVITHRRGTMEEADVLYGVTMQDEGVSKLLELNASEIENRLGIK